MDLESDTKYQINKKMYVNCQTGNLVVTGKRVVKTY